MKADIDRWPDGVDRDRAIIEGDGVVAGAQKNGVDVLDLQFVLQAPRDGEIHVFLFDRVGDGCAPFIASVGRIDDDHETWVL